MNKNPMLLTVACSLMFFSGCAAKNRWFSRKDYSEMQDPFMDSEALADKDSGKSTTTTPDGDDTGRARLGGSSSAMAASKDPGAGTPPASGRSVMQTSASEEGVARTGTVSNASYPERSASAAGPAGQTTPGTKSYSGPALSDFLSKKQTQTVNSAAETANEVSRIAKGSPPNPRTVSPAARAAALPEIEKEAEGFSNFLQEKSNTVNARTQQAAAAINTKTQQAASTVKQSEESVEDFASWATQEQQKWNTKGNEAASAAAAVPGAVKQQAKATTKQARKTVDDAVMDFNTPEFDDEVTAQPLMKRYARPAKPQMPAFEEAEMEAEADSFEEVEEENPFENPFESSDFEPAPVRKPVNPAPAAKKPATSGTSRKSIDNSFQMDSGWKPSNFEHP